MKNILLALCLTMPVGLLAHEVLLLEHKPVKQEVAQKEDVEKKEQEEQQDKKAEMTPEKKSSISSCFM